MIRPAPFALAAALLAASAPAADDEGFTPLFDGKTTSGWTPVDSGAGNWTAHDGLLITKGAGGGWLSTDKTYRNFILRLEYRLRPGGNSGVFLRSPRSGDPAYSGMEVQILDDEDERYRGKLKPGQYAGSVYLVAPAKPGHTKKAGEWNAMEITADGTKITVKLNGATVVDTDLKDHADAEKEHPGIKRPEGYIGLQSHSEPVEFRDIRIKELK